MARPGPSAGVASAVARAGAARRERRPTPLTTAPPTSRAPQTRTARWNELTEADFAAMATAGGALAAGGLSGWTIARSAGSAASTPGAAPARAA